jgi:hypothetical protein
MFNIFPPRDEGFVCMVSFLFPFLQQGLALNQDVLKFFSENSQLLREGHGGGRAPFENFPELYRHNWTCAKVSGMIEDESKLAKSIRMGE